MGENGVYLPSANLDSSVLVDCLRALIDIYPSAIITSTNVDEKLRGFKICFSGPDAASVVKKKFLTYRSYPIWIYPLTATLTINNVIRGASPSYKSELHQAISEQFGKIVHVTTTKISEYTEEWRVQLSVPEFKGLDVFHQENSSDLTIILPKWNEKLKVEFWCRHCEKGGHFQHECVLENNSEPNVENHKVADGKKAETKADESQPVKDTSQSNSRSPVRDTVGRIDELAPKISQKSIDSLAERIGREEVLNSGILLDENSKSAQVQRKESTSNTSGLVNNILSEKEIKKENDANGENSSPSKKGDYSLSKEAHDRNVTPKQEPHNRMDEVSLNSFQDEDDDDILFMGVGYTDKPRSANASSHDSNTAGRDGADNSEDASRSPTNVRSNYSFPSFAETEPFVMSPGPSSRAKPASRVEVTSVLSDRLQSCINHACDTCRVLDRRTLDAFLIHVKKKSNPVRVALNFTKNADGLKGQLEKILHMYYNTPQTGTKEDMQFIKWLNGLVGRFDGTIPRKRKRNEQNSDGTPNKK